MTATITLANGVAFDGVSKESILDSAAAAGIVLEHSCRTGRCGVCRAQVSYGQSEALKPEIYLSAAEIEAGNILTCCRTAISDLALDIEDVSALADYPVRTSACRIDTIDRLTSDVVKVGLRLPPNAPLAFLPGQHIEIIRGDIRRAYSIANAPRPDGRLEMLIKRFDGGVMSAYWFEQAAVNDLLRLEGPMGTFFCRDLPDTRIVMLATGTGIGPVKAMLEEMGRGPNPPSVMVYWGERTREDIYLDASDFGSFVDFRICLSRAGSDRRSYVQDVAISDIGDFRDCVIYACGSTGMIETARPALVHRGLPPRRFYSDAFVQS
jgi:CDP-4-dehydro-6-deoxyglucose reductase